jgi:hypothetical protein
MFSDHKLKWRPIILIGCLLSIVVWCIILLFAGASFQALLPSLMKFGVVFSVVWGVWEIFYAPWVAMAMAPVGQLARQHARLER